MTLRVKVATAHMSKSISSIPALISIAIRRVDKTRCVIKTLFISTLNTALWSK